MRYIKRHNNVDYERIRFLIERFYVGETSPAQEAELFDFFNIHNPLTLPEDLKSEAEVFSVMNTFGAKTSDEVLLQEIEIEIAREGKSNKHAVIRFVWRFSAIAVSVLLMACIISSIFTSADVIDEIKPRIAETLPDTISSEKVEQADPTYYKIQYSPQRNAVASIPVKGSCCSFDDSRAIEVCDSAEAAHYLEKVSRLLKDAYNENARLQNRVSSRISKSTEIINTTLNKL